MTSETSPDPALVGELLDVLRPLLARLRAERTLSPGKVGIMHHLSQHGRATSAELAAAVRVSPQAISLSTRELEELSYIARVQDDADRRRSWIVLTETGRTKLQQEILTGARWMGQVVSERLSGAERETLKSAIPVLKKLGLEESHG